MAYSSEVPDDYNRKFVLAYDKNNNIDDKLINATDEIMQTQDKYLYNPNENIINKPTVRYNPLFSPSDLIDHAIHLERYKDKNGNVVEPTSNDNKKEIYRSNVISIAKELLKRLDLYYYKTELSTISKTITTKEYNDINQFFYYTTT